MSRLKKLNHYGSEAVIGWMVSQDRWQCTHTRNAAHIITQKQVTTYPDLDKAILDLLEKICQN
jgi:hypothetical protein